MNPKTLFACGAALGLVAVAAGAFGAHALSDRLAPDRLTLYETAARYQMYHALAILAAALAASQWNISTSNAGWAFLIGVVIFCGSVYALAFGAPRWFGAITPIGGLAFLAGWLMLALSVLRASK